MADEDVVELNPNDLTTEYGVGELIRMIRVLYNNTPGNLGDVRVFAGYGSPESNVAANVGSIYQRYDGASGATIYIKESGTGDTGWVGMNGTIGLDKGGTGASLTDPNDDRIFFWDDSNSTTDWLDIGTGLDLTGTTLSSTGTIEVFTSNGTWTQPSGVTTALILMCGGGGGGGGNGGGGGGGGESVLFTSFPVSADVTVTIGAGGAGGVAAGAGAAGSASSFGSLSVSGGSGGAQTGGAGGAGGVANTINGSGQTAGAFGSFAGGTGGTQGTTGGGGGGTYFGAGGAGGGAGVVGVAPAVNTGAGGGGGGNANSNGAAGADGICIVAY